MQILCQMKEKQKMSVSQIFMSCFHIILFSSGSTVTETLKLYLKKIYICYMYNCILFFYSILKSLYLKS